MKALAGIMAAALAPVLDRMVAARSLLVFAGGGLLCGAVLSGETSLAAGRLLMEGALCLFFFEAGLRLTNQQVRLVRTASKALLQSSIPCMTAILVLSLIISSMMEATPTQGLLVGLVLLPLGVLSLAKSPPLRTAVLLGHVVAGLGGVVVLTFLADLAPEPAWTTALRHVFVCIGFVSIALLMRSSLVPHQMKAAAHGNRKALVFTAALVMGLFGSALWIGPASAFAFFVTGLMLSRGRWNGHAPSALLRPQALYASLLFAAFGLLVTPQAMLDLWPLMVSVAGGLLLLRVGAAALYSTFASSERCAQASCMHPLLAPLGAASFLVLCFGIDAQLVPDAWGSVAPSLLAGVALMLAAAAALERRRRPAPESQPGRSVEAAEIIRQRLCRGPFVVHKRHAVRKRRSGLTPHLHLVPVARGAPATHLPLHRLALDQNFGVQVLGLWHRDAYVAAPPDNYTLQAGDCVLLSAAPARLSRSISVFRRPSSFS